MERVTMTEEQLLQVLREAMAKPSDTSGTFSVNDVRQTMGVGERTARRLIRELILRDQAECTQILQRNMAGVVTPVPRYRLRVSQD